MGHDIVTFIVTGRNPFQFLAASSNFEFLRRSAVNAIAVLCVTSGICECLFFLFFLM